MRRPPSVLLAVAGGGALGALARYGLSRVIHVAPGSFPWATFWTNISGSAMLGFALVVLHTRFPSRRAVRAFVATGILGAYTTFSTFTVETDLLIRDGHLAVGVGYVAASVIAGGAAVWIGMRVAAFAASAREPRC